MECVLMQAWKKTSGYLRYHNWYADTLGIDLQTLRVPSFLQEIQRRLDDPEQWESRPLKIIPAPKNQKWTLRNGQWGPLGNIRDGLRPLAHVDLQDQVVATAMMLCLADRVETTLGDPRLPVSSKANRAKVLAYGHRLFCDNQTESLLRHRWGSSKLYRGYYRDYRTFLERPETAATDVDLTDDSLEVAIVQSDLSKFYDRVRPNLLGQKLLRFQERAEERPFFNLAGRVLNWHWASGADAGWARRYGIDHDLQGFEDIALPQGLVAGGFFANVALVDFDTELRQKIGTVLSEDNQLVLHDVCYYVDDLRLVLTLPSGSFPGSESQLEEIVVEALQQSLSSTAPGLEVASEKTSVTIKGREKRFLIQQGREAARIQAQGSGTFDAAHGTKLIAQIEGFFHTQQQFSNSDGEQDNAFLTGIPDMADDTAARFAAGRMRRTFRSLRPLLPGEPDEESSFQEEGEGDEPVPKVALVISKSQLDEKGRVFSGLLIEQWVKNPGNIRLLRIALDLYPDHEFLDAILNLLRPAWRLPSVKGAKREIMLYCIADLFRAGATETGIVAHDESESLPSRISVDDYHERLIQEALEIFNAYTSGTSLSSRFPWYLMQQVFLYLAARDQVPHLIRITNRKGGALLRHYWGMLKFLHGHEPVRLEERALYLVESSTAFGIGTHRALEAVSRVSLALLERVNSVSPFVARALWQKFENEFDIRARKAAIKLGLELRPSLADRQTLADLTPESNNPFFEEENILRLAEFLLSRNASEFEEPVLPSEVAFSLETNIAGYAFGKVADDSFAINRASTSGNIHFASPDWCENNGERQRFNVGLLLRYALRASIEFLSNEETQGEGRRLRYVKPVSHWEQQRYSGYQGRDAFGPPWLPLSSFTENLLTEILRWPGSGSGTEVYAVDSLLEGVVRRLQFLTKERGQYTSTTFLDQSAPWPARVSSNETELERHLRIGIVQTVIPNAQDYRCHTDPQLNGQAIRFKRRTHLAAIMQGVNQMLLIRDTHRTPGEAGYSSIDLLIFPELSIHPNDIKSIILPFVRQHRCMALFGQIYHPRDRSSNSPLINSGLWLIPEWSPSHGLQIKRLEQGKAHLTEEERKNISNLQGFRPVQWLIDYQWHTNTKKPRLRLSASICYDATDIALSADLCSRSDIYVVCALNKDVGTFDRMAEALHYHMFQGVALVNNGQYGGSSFSMPFRGAYHREVFSLHGQNQASITFVDVNARKLIFRPADPADLCFSQKSPIGEYKSPPARWESRQNL